MALNAPQSVDHVHRSVTRHREDMRHAETGHACFHVVCESHLLLFIHSDREPGSSGVASASDGDSGKK